MPKLWENCRETDGRKGGFNHTYPFTLARMSEFWILDDTRDG
ncbi:hypothetical protein [Dolichospermum sp. UHCC 0259]|nr:hypothetical protein [Dolichospermum sp. UHCC 0259]